MLASLLSHPGLGDPTWSIWTQVMSDILGARNMNALENQASGFEVAIGAGCWGKNNALEQLVLIKGTLMHRPWYPISWILIQHAHSPYSLLWLHAVLQPLKEQIYQKHIFWICLNFHIIDSCSNAVWRQWNQRHCIQLPFAKGEIDFAFREDWRHFDIMFCDCLDWAMS